MLPGNDSVRGAASAVRRELIASAAKCSNCLQTQYSLNTLLAEPGILKSAFLADMGLARSLPPGKAHLTWSGALLRALGWLAGSGAPFGEQVRS